MRTTTMRCHTCGGELTPYFRTNGFYCKKCNPTHHEDSERRRSEFKRKLRMRKTTNVLNELYEKEFKLEEGEQ